MSSLMLVLLVMVMNVKCDESMSLSASPEISFTSSMFFLESPTSSLELPTPMFFPESTTLMFLSESSPEFSTSMFLTESPTPSPTLMFLSESSPEFSTPMFLTESPTPSPEISSTLMFLSESSPEFSTPMFLTESPTPSPEISSTLMFLPESLTPSPEISFTSMSLSPTPSLSPESPTPSPGSPTPSPESPTPSPESLTPSPETSMSLSPTPSPSPESPTPSPESLTPSPEISMSLSPTPSPSPEISSSPLPSSVASTTSSVTPSSETSSSSSETSSSSSEPSSSSTVTKKATSSSGGIVGGAIGGILIIIVIVSAIFIFVLVIVRRKKTVRSYKLGPLLDESDNAIVLSELTEPILKNTNPDLESTFTHIPAFPPILLADLEKYVDNLHENDDENGQEEFELLQDFNRNYPQAISNKDSNSMKNRYINILPFDDTRVVLSTVNKKQSDYINANYVSGYNHNKEYIASQGPLPNTIDDFWQMIWENKCEIIVMVTNPTENGNPKCEVYWPQEGQATQFNTVSVTNISETIQPSCTIRSFLLSGPNKPSNKSDKRQISSSECIQFHFTTWPDMAVPTEVISMIRFVGNVRKRAKTKTIHSPIVVHCSAGVGRTGTFMAIDVMLQRMENEGDINVKKYVLKMRAQRPSMVQTLPQYLFIYDCLLHEYLYGETEVNREDISTHYDQLMEVFPDSEESRMEREFEGAGTIVVPDSSFLEVATDPINIKKNRSGPGIPLDINRVHLNDPYGTGSDYINASYAGVSGRRAEYVITQHPLKETINDFWRMMLERNFSTIVILGPVTEEEEYWPMEKSLDCDGISVILTESDESDHVKVMIFEIECEETEECLTVKLFHLFDWPTDEVPTSTLGVLELSTLLHEHGKGLTVVHSSSSIQEECSGVFCVIHSLNWKLIDGNQVDIMQSARRVLQQRPGCLTNKEQYQFIYEALIDGTN